MTNLQRRRLLQAGAGTAALAGLTASGCATMGGGAGGKVVVIGGGYGGATAAKYLRKWSEGKVEVTLVERNAAFVSCPISNLVIGGHRKIEDVTHGYDGLRKWGVNVVRGEVTGIDAGKRQVRLADGTTLAWDRLVVSPGVDFMYEAVPGLKAAEDEGRILHAWKAGPQTVALRRQLEAMRDGGVYAIAIPLAPYRCPPGPYERACQVASYLKVAKPRSKVLILDANPDVTSKGPLFKKAWADLYPGMVEYRGNNALQDVDARTLTAKLQLDDVKADVLNVVPPMRAGDIARQAGLINANNRWCNVDWLTLESTAVKGIHVLGDATLSAPAMPKSGHMANQHAKVAAAAILELLAGRAPNPSPVVTNTCYSFVDAKEVVHVASVHQYVAEKKTFETVAGSGGVSSARSELEGGFAMGWAYNIWADTLG
jgi:sulfite dehydrogenase